MSSETPAAARKVRELTAAGQPRLDTGQFFRELANELFSLERGLPWTLYQLFRHPGSTIRCYIVERDPRITRPIRLLLISLAVAALAAHLSSADEAFFHGLVQGSAGQEPSLQTAITTVFRNLDAILLLCWVPAVAASTLHCYPRSALNLAEAFTLGCYSLVLLLWLFLPLLGNLLPADWTAPAALLGVAAPLLACNYAFHRPAGYGIGRALYGALLTLGLAALSIMASVFLALPLVRFLD